LSLLVRRLIGLSTVAPAESVLLPFDTNRPAIRRVLALILERFCEGVARLSVHCDALIKMAPARRHRDEAKSAFLPDKMRRAASRRTCRSQVLGLNPASYSCIDFGEVPSAPRETPRRLEPWHRLNVKRPVLHRRTPEQVFGITNAACAVIKSEMHFWQFYLESLIGRVAHCSDDWNKKQDVQSWTCLTTAVLSFCVQAAPAAIAEAIFRRQIRSSMRKVTPITVLATIRHPPAPCTQACLPSAESRRR
jgi:hypothetical protein